MKNLIFIIIFCCLSLQSYYSYSYGGRTIPKWRTFNSSSVEKIINNVTSIIKDKSLKKIFENCFPNTLDTTIKHFQSSPYPDSFIITGDIKAMWLRDSTNQVYPYIQFIKEDEHLKQLILGLINRQINYINIDPYANAFNNGPTGGEWQKDNTTKLNEKGQNVKAMNPWIWERKYEIDSLAAVLRLSYRYYEITKDTSFITFDWLTGFYQILETFQQQRFGSVQEMSLKKIPYTFSRSKDSGMLPFGKYCGMIKSGFRPSDDECKMPYFVPGNAMVSVYLQKISEMLTEFKSDNQQLVDFSLSLKEAALDLSQGIKKAIYEYGVDKDEDGNEFFVYEVDGQGNKNFMDDANVPSLLSLPYIGFVNQTDKIYQNTRKRILSNKNQYYFQGKAASGIGSPHTGNNNIWHMSLIMQAMTTDNDEEIKTLLGYLKSTTADTNFMHESFDKDNARKFTRSWFAWANSLFGEFIIDLLDKKPQILKDFN